MKKIFVLIICGAIIIAAPSAADDAGKDAWYPFTIPAKLDPDSAANIGRLVLNGPAGKHGFVKTKDGHFFFEDGTRARFWGTNLCFSACFPAKEQASWLADRLAFFGFNAVRLHHMDFFFEPEGIFKDEFPFSKYSQIKNTQNLSAKQLDRLDYFINELKVRGIYVDMNLLVSRHFTEADGVANAEKLGMAAKPASLFDPKLIELQKKYAKDLLTHYNPYTKLRYCDDPAIALVEITNENSIFDYWKWNKLNGTFAGLKEDALPDYYVKQLDEKWREWLKKKYGPDANVKDGRPIYKFKYMHPPEKIKDVEDFYTDLEKKYFEDMISFLKKDTNIKVPITGLGGYSNIQDIKAEDGCNFIDRHGYWDHPKFPDKPWDLNDFRIENNSLLQNAGADMINGLIADSREATRCSKPFTMTEWNQCYPNQYAYEMPLILASVGIKEGWDGLFEFAFSHAWTDRMVFDNIRSFFDIFNNSQKLILCSAASYYYLNSSIVKSDAGNGIYRIDSTKARGVIGFIKNAQQTTDYMTILSEENGVVFLYSAENKVIEKSNKLILIAISEIKNNHSGWTVDGKFNWGSPPTFLKRMNIKISISLGKHFKVYALAPDGKRVKQLDTTFENNVLTFTTNNSDTPWFEIDIV